MMSTFIARMIMEATDKSLEEGQEKYRAYFCESQAVCQVASRC